MAAHLVNDSPRITTEPRHLAAAGLRVPARRADIDGLRVLAISLVVVYHVWIGRVSGGVDVFLLLSAYLLTHAFVRRAERGDPPAILSSIIRRFARLLPAATAVILAVLGWMAFAWAPSTWAPMWSQAWASLFYVQNWELAFSSADYYSRDVDTLSPFQHFWSLSIQGQVFILWPLILVTAIALGRRLGSSARRSAGVAFSIVFVASLAYSIVSTVQNQQFAYFDTGARLWEFALGSLAAVAAPSIRLPRAVVHAIAWLGLIGLLVCGAVLNVGTQFPGYVALWPTLCAVALLFAGGSTTRSAPTAFLSARPLQLLAPLAYGLYLVHWPILVAALILLDSSALDLLQGAVVISLSLIAAFVLHILIERPLLARTGQIRWSSGIVVATIALVTIPLASWQGYERWRAANMEPVENPGASVLMPWLTVKTSLDADLIPFGSALDEEWVHLDERCSGDFRPAQAAARTTCTQTVAESADAPTVLVMGDSHAEQWMGAVLPVAEQQDWNMVAVLKGGCSLSVRETPVSSTSCRTWQEAAIRYAQDLKPDLVVMMGTKAEREGSGERVPRGLDDVIDRVSGEQTQVLLVRDNPRFDVDMYGCIEEHGPESALCKRERSDVLAKWNPAERLQSDRVDVLDLTEYLCPNGICEPVIGNVAVYMDDNHLTWAYARTLAPAFEVAVEKLPGW